MLALATFGLSIGVSRAADDYQLGPDSLPQAGVPAGKVEKFTLAGSRFFPGTTRDYWVYAPAAYRPDVAACVMVFQDGAGFVKPDGNWHVPTVFDNLIHKKEMPVTIGVFVNPGVVPAPRPDAQPRFNRSFEYDALGDRYARFLIEELLPEVGKRYNLSADPNCRAIAGGSSGAIAAFTVAWQRPDAFRRVYSAIGTYVGLRGGDGYAALVRQSEPKPLRIFLQDGSADQSGYGGSWWFANQAMLQAFEFAGYEVDHVFGDGGHTGKQGGATFPEALRFLWKGFPAAPKAGKGSHAPVLDVVGVVGDGGDDDPDNGWHPVTEGLGHPVALAAASNGDLYVSDDTREEIWRIPAFGKPARFVEKSGGAYGLAYGADGRLFATQPKKKQIVAFDSKGRETVVATGINARGIAVARTGLLWVTDPAAGTVTLVGDGGSRVVGRGLGVASALSLTPDQAFLYVADESGRFVSSYLVNPDGTLANGQPFCHLHLDDRDLRSGAASLNVDVVGRLYVASRIGIQFCDQAGRVNGIIDAPTPGPVSAATFGGKGLGDLFAISGTRVYRRATKTNGVLSAEPPIKPPAPRL